MPKRSDKLLGIKMLTVVYCPAHASLSLVTHRIRSTGCYPPVFV